jgi:outer membrane lipoprotein-sorting protein
MLRNFHAVGVCAVLLGWAGSARAQPDSQAKKPTDERAAQLVREITAKAASFRTLSGNLRMVNQFGKTKMSSTGTVRLKKPNLALIVMKEKVFGDTVSSDGKTVTNLMGGEQYMKMPADPTGSNINMGWAYPVTMFFSPTEILKHMSSAGLTYGGTETVGGVTYDRLISKDDMSTTTLYVRPDRLVTRVRIDVKQESQSLAVSAELTDVKVNGPIRAADLAFRLPKTAKLYKQPDFDAKLLRVGAMAEKFDLVALQGDNITLDRVAKGKKAVLVNFWFYG